MVRLCEFELCRLSGEGQARVLTINHWHNMHLVVPVHLGGIGDFDITMHLGDGLLVGR